MSPELEKIFIFIKKHPGVTTAQIEKFTRTARATVWNQTKQLVNLGLIKETLPIKESSFFAVKNK